MELSSASASASRRWCQAGRANEGARRPLDARVWQRANIGGFAGEAARGLATVEIGSLSAQQYIVVQRGAVQYTVQCRAVRAQRVPEAFCSCSLLPVIIIIIIIIIMTR
jgi:hypothetical protein